MGVVTELFKTKTRGLLALLIVAGFVAVAVWTKALDPLEKVATVVVTAYFVDRAGKRAGA